MEGEERLCIRFKYEDLPEFQEDAEALTKRIVMQKQAHIIAVEEAREKLGYDSEFPDTDETPAAPAPLPPVEPEGTPVAGEEE